MARRNLSITYFNPQKRANIFENSKSTKRNEITKDNRQKVYSKKR